MKTEGEIKSRIEQLSNDVRATLNSLPITDKEVQKVCRLNGEIKALGWMIEEVKL